MFTRIVVGTDGSDTATEAVRQAAELAKSADARLDIVAAYTPIRGQRLKEESKEAPGDVQYEFSDAEDVNLALESAKAEVKKSGVSEVETHAVEGDPADAIIDVAEEVKADLIVVGNKGMTGARRFLLGSVPNKVSHHAPSSVMIIRTT